MLGNFKSEIRICNRKIVGLSCEVGLNRGKVTDRKIGENKAWSACPSRFQNDCKKLSCLKKRGLKLRFMPFDHSPNISAEHSKLVNFDIL